MVPLNPTFRVPGNNLAGVNTNAYPPIAPISAGSGQVSNAAALRSAGASEQSATQALQNHLNTNFNQWYADQDPAALKSQFGPKQPIRSSFTLKTDPGTFGNPQGVNIHDENPDDQVAADAATRQAARAHFNQNVAPVDKTYGADAYNALQAQQTLARNARSAGQSIADYTRSQNPPLDPRVQVANIRERGVEYNADSRGNALRDVGAGHDAATTQRAGITAGATTQRAQTTADSNIQRANIQAGSQQAVGAGHDAATVDAANIRTAGTAAAAATKQANARYVPTPQEKLEWEGQSQSYLNQTKQHFADIRDNVANPTPLPDEVPSPSWAGKTGQKAAPVAAPAPAAQPSPAPAATPPAAAQAAPQGKSIEIGPSAGSVLPDPSRPGQFVSWNDATKHWDPAAPPSGGALAQRQAAPSPITSQGPVFTPPPQPAYKNSPIGLPIANTPGELLTKENHADIVKAFLDSAGGDPSLATRIAKNHRWRTQ